MSQNRRPNIRKIFEKLVNNEKSRPLVLTEAGYLDFFIQITLSKPQIE